MALAYPVQDWHDVQVLLQNLWRGLREVEREQERRTVICEEDIAVRGEGKVIDCVEFETEIVVKDRGGFSGACV